MGVAEWCVACRAGRAGFVGPGWGRTAFRRTAALLGVVASLVGCGAHGRSFEGGIFKDGPVAFRVGEVPSSWRRVDVTDGSLAFKDTSNDAAVLVNARCTPGESDAPLVALTNHLLMGSTEREVLSQEVEPFDGREALHSRVSAKWDGVAMALDIFVLKKDGCVYDFVYTTRPAAIEGGAPAFESFVRSFRTLPGSGVVRG